MTEPKMTLKECIEQLEWCDYECEAGKLKCNIAFRQLKTVVDRIEFCFKRQLEIPENVGEWSTREDLIRIEQNEKFINYILTGCNDETVVRLELEKMGYK